MTPNDPEFWPKTMKRDGATASREQMAQAWRWWTEANRARDSLLLGRGLKRVGVWSAEWPGRLADAMLQRARKAGHIHYDGRQWQEGPGK